MPRQAKPYLHRQWFVTNMGGSRHRLCHENDGYSAAQEALGELLRERRQGGIKRYDNLTVAELAALYLASRAGKIHEISCRAERLHLTWFCQAYGGLQAIHVTRLQVQQFMDRLEQRKTRRKGTPLRPKTINDAICTVRHCWKWGIDTDLIPDQNPLDRLVQHSVEGRNRLMTNAEFQSLLREAPIEFRRVELVLRYTSMRPGELRKLKWAMVEWTNRRFVIPQHKTSKMMKTPKPRIIPFPACVEALLRWLHQQFGERSPFIFLNSLGQPWSCDALCKCMDDTRTRAGIEPDSDGEPLVLYTNRHTYITAAASNGIDGPTLQNLAGHTNPKMTARYAHLADRTMSIAANKVVAALKPQQPALNGMSPATVELTATV
jgi:integrase